MRTYRRKSMYLALIILLFLVGVGYAVLNANLTINGISLIANSTWDVHFENPQATSNSVVTPSVAPAADPVDKVQTLSYVVTFDKPGQVYEFTVDVANRGSIDAMINGITSTLQVGEETTNLLEDDLPPYIDYYVKYSDGAPIIAKQKLIHGTTEELIVHVEFKKSVTVEELATARGQVYHFTYGLEYVQANGEEINVAHAGFNDHSWDDVVSNILNNTIPSTYTVGATKEITLSLDLNNDGVNETHTYHVRIVNTSTPADCYTEGFSQSACGLVFEFVEPITTSVMNPKEHEEDEYGTNAGGWRDSYLRNYMNTTILQGFPVALRNAITETSVVTGHGGKYGDTNTTTSDKLFLLSTAEIKSGGNNKDSARDSTRLLDYYESLENDAGLVKTNGSGPVPWWTRTPVSTTSACFIAVSSSGGWNEPQSQNSYGFAPAFRIVPSE